jgi:hypothetical protein
MKEYKPVMVSVEDLSSVKCDKCQKEMLTDCSPFGNGICIKYKGGYDSEHFGDGSDIEIDLCEECLFEFVKSFKKS